MSTATRTRVIAASQQELWELIGDPHHQPRWWPGVERVEGVGEKRFTQVLKSRRGRSVRVDYLVAEAQAPWTTSWRQQLAGTPFARVLREAAIQFDLEPRPTREGGPATAVTLTHVQKPRGYSRTGSRMIRRATGERLEQALAGLALILGG